MALRRTRLLPDLRERIARINRENKEKKTQPEQTEKPTYRNADVNQDEFVPRNVNIEPQKQPQEDYLEDWGPSAQIYDPAKIDEKLGVSRDELNNEVQAQANDLTENAQDSYFFSRLIKQQDFRDSIAYNILNLFVSSLDFTQEDTAGKLSQQLSQGGGSSVA